MFAACADGSFASLYGNYSGQGINTTFVHDTKAGYDVLQCTQVRKLLPCMTCCVAAAAVSVASDGFA